MSLLLKDPTLLRSQAYLDGAWVGEPKLPITNPATGQVVSHVPDFGAAEAEAAVLAAEKAFKPGRSCRRRSVPPSSAAGSS